MFVGRNKFVHVMKYAVCILEIKSLKVFRLKVAILGLKYVNSVMFNCSLLSKTYLNVCRPKSPKLFLLGTSCKLAVKADNTMCIITLYQTKLGSTQQCPSGAPAVPSNQCLKSFLTSNECLKSFMKKK